MEQPITAASKETDLFITEAQRFHILNVISSARVDFTKLRRNSQIWDLFTDDGYSWDDLTTMEVPKGERGGQLGAYLKTREAGIEDVVEVRVNKTQIQSLIDFLREKLNEKAPKDGKPDTRWVGAVGVQMITLYDKLHLLAGD